MTGYLSGRHFSCGAEKSSRKTMVGVEIGIVIEYLMVVCR
jgi:hypothetical protein